MCALQSVQVQYNRRAIEYVCFTECTKQYNRRAIEYVCFTECTKQYNRTAIEYVFLQSVQGSLIQEPESMCVLQSVH